MDDEALPAWVKPGASFTDATNPNRSDKWHVRAIVDDMAVARRWREAKQAWHYEMLDGYFFTVRAAHITHEAAKGF